MKVKGAGPMEGDKGCFPPDKDGPEMVMGFLSVRSLSWAPGPRDSPRLGALRRGGRL